MGITADYVDSSSFTVPGDKTNEFVEGRRVKADCDTDGTVYSEVTSASYDSSPDETTVTLDDSVLTDNLVEVWYGVVASGAEGALPIHDHVDGGQGGTVAHSSLADVGSSDHHSRYTDSEAADAAPVQKVAGKTGDVSLGKSDVGLDNVPDEDATDPENWDLDNSEGNFIVGDGSTFVTESGSTARDSLGLGSAATKADTKYAHRSNNLSDLDSASSARDNLGLGTQATKDQYIASSSQNENDGDVTYVV